MRRKKNVNRMRKKRKLGMMTRKRAKTKAKREMKMVMSRRKRLSTISTTIRNRLDRLIKSRRRTFLMTFCRKERFSSARARVI